MQRFLSQIGICPLEKGVDGTANLALDLLSHLRRVFSAIFRVRHFDRLIEVPERPDLPDVNELAE